MATFLARLAADANQIGDRLRALEEKRRLDFVRKIYAESDVCFALWPDPRRGDGVGCRILKGAKLMEDQTADKGASMRVVALPFESEKHAAAIGAELGG